MRRIIGSLSVLVALVSALLVFLAPVYAGADHPNYHWSGTATYNCFPGGLGAQGSIINITLERDNIPDGNVIWRIYAIINGVETLQTSGPGNPGSGVVGDFSFNFTDTAFPIQAAYRVDTIVDNEIVYQSTLSVLCTAEVYGVETDFPFNQDVNIPLEAATTTCSTPLPTGSPIGMIIDTTTALWGPDAGDVTNVVLAAGSHWHVIGTQDGFDRLWIACLASPVWVNSDNVAVP